MKTLDLILILAVAFLSIFWEAAFDGFRRLLGAQPSLLPSLMVYTALRGSTLSMALLACLGGLWFDSLSANPLGVTVLPLLTTGLALHYRRDLILRSQVFAQSVLGSIASVLVPGLTLVLLLTMGEHPLVGWGTLWQFIIMAGAGAIAAPAIFMLFEWLESKLAYAGPAETSFRSDREIRRGR